MAKPISVIVPYHRNREGLVSTLINLQSQLVPPQCIVVVDTSRNRSGLEIANRFATHGNVPVIVKMASRVNIYEAWNLGLKVFNPDYKKFSADVVIINDDLLMPMNFIDILGIARDQVPALAYVPTTPTREFSSDRVEVNFPWYNEIPNSLNDYSPTHWLTGFCFMLTSEAINRVGFFDEKFKIWFGDDDYQRRLEKAVKTDKEAAIVKINPLYVYHYGGKSYQYQSKTTQKIIDKDRHTFIKKYEGQAS